MTLLKGERYSVSSCMGKYPDIEPVRPFDQKEAQQASVEEREEKGERPPVSDTQNNEGE